MLYGEKAIAPKGLQFSVEEVTH